MFTYVISRAIERGYVDASYRDMALDGYQGVLQRISLNSSGLTDLSQICVGTGAGSSLTYYYSRPRIPNDPHGLGSFLIMNEQLIHDIGAHTPVPVLVSPTDGSIVDVGTPTFDWEDAVDAVQYQIQVDDDVDFSSPEIDDDTLTASIYTPASALTNRVYYWRVRVGVGGGVWSEYGEEWLATVAVVPGAATPEAPVGGETVTSLPVTYSWPEATGADEYRLYVLGPSGMLVHDGWHAAATVCSGGTCAVAPTTSYTNGTHTWWLQTRNSAGNGPWSSATTFVFDCPTCAPPGAATPGSPTGGTTVTSTPVTFSWPAVASAAQYRLYVLNNTAGTLIHDAVHTDSDLGCPGGTGTCSVAPSASYTNGSYIWYLQSSNSYGDGPWSGPANFVLDCPSCGPPGAATPGSPTGGTTVTSTPVTYSWPSVAGATQYRLYVVNNTAGILVHDAAHTATDLGCSGGGTCSVTPSASYTNGDYTWYLLSKNSYGDGPWSGPANFTFNDGTGPPSAATPGAPVGGTTVTSAPVTFSWPAVATATEYRLYVVNDTAGTLIHDAVHTDSDLGCPGGTGTCSVAPSASYTNGSYTWYLLSKNSYGDGPWSGPVNFVLDCPSCGPPGAAMPGSPTGGTTVTSTPVTYSWPSVAGATQYRLYVVNNTAGVLVHDAVHTATDLGCSGGGTCSVAPSASYTNGSYTWYLQASNSYGNGSWSGPAYFAFDCPTCAPPGAATPGSPTGGTTVTSAPVTYTWPSVAGATQYRLYVLNNTAGILIHDTWHAATDLGCSGGIGTCSVTPTASYTNGDYTWYLLTSNSHGDGPWSSAAPFVILAAPPEGAGYRFSSSTSNDSDGLSYSSPWIRCLTGIWSRMMLRAI